MSQNAQSLENQAAAASYPSLSTRDTLLCLVGYFASQTGLTAAAAMVQAATAGYGALSDGDLNELILETI